MGDRVKHNDLYVLLPRLEHEGRLTHQGHGWYPPGWLQASQDTARREALAKRPRT